MSCHIQQQANLLATLTRTTLVVAILFVAGVGSANAQWSIGNIPPGGIPSGYHINYDGGLQYGMIKGVTTPYKCNEDDFEFNQAGPINLGVSTILQWTGGGTPPKTATLLLSCEAFGNAAAASASGLAQATADDGEGDAPVLSGPTFISGVGYETGTISEGYHVQVCDTSGGNSWYVTPPISASASGAAGPSTAIRYEFQVIQPASISATSSNNVIVGPYAQYVSGTNCNISGVLPSFPSNSPVYITSAQLMLNGTVVNSYTNTTGAPDPNVPYYLQATFDSTHFASGTALNATIMATDSQGNNYGGVLGEPTNGTASYPVIVNNKGLGLANVTVDALGANAVELSEVSDDLKSINFNPVATTQSYNVPQVAQAIPPLSVLFAHTHANSECFNDCFADQDGLEAGGVDGRVWAQKIEECIALKGVADPPYNFVDIDGCNSLGSETIYDPQIAQSFGIGNPDTAYLGWLDEIVMPTSMAWVETIWDDLSSGDTLLDAIDDGAIDLPIAKTIDLVPKSGFYGDPLMTLTSVYGGTGGSEWYRTGR